MGRRKIKNRETRKLFILCPLCGGDGYTTTLEIIDSAKYKGIPQQVKHHCDNCDHGYVKYK